MKFDTAKFYLILSNGIICNLDQKILEVDLHVDTRKCCCVNIKLLYKLTF